MVDLTRLPHLLDAAQFTCRAVIETPKGRRSKYDYSPELGGFELAGLLPEGMSFPLDFLRMMFGISDAWTWALLLT